jgi:hypothetical protein
MRTTVDIPDVVLERARVRGAELGISLKKFVAEAVTRKVVDDREIPVKKMMPVPPPRKRG